MNWEIIFVLAVLAGALVSFVLEKIPPDQTAMTVFAVILAAGMLPFSSRLPDLEELITVFSNPAPLTIAAMFILSAALEKCGFIRLLAGVLDKVTGWGYLKFSFTMIFAVAVISAFINNTPVVIVFLPLVLSLSRRMDIPASKLLIPLSYASIFGGVCTLVGTSTNILASGMMEAAGRPPLSMFELSKIGLPLLFVSAFYLVFLGRHLLPRRESLTSILTEEERKEYLTEAFILKDSPLAGRTVADSGILQTRHVRIIEIIRNGIRLAGDPRKAALREGDRLVLACRPSGFAHARSVEGIDLQFERNVGLEKIAAHEGSIVEGVIGPNSPIAGQSITDLNFRQRYRMIVVAIHRRGVNLRQQIDTIPLQFGDTLLMMGTNQAIEEMRKSSDILLLDRPATPSYSKRRKMPIVAGTLTGMISLATFDVMPILAAAVLACVIIFATGCLKPKEAYQTIEWGLLILIYGMLAMGLAMEKTGTADLIAQGLARLAEGAISPALKPYVLLGALYLCTTILTELLSNNATIVLMAPIALGLGQTLGLDPRPFVITACVAASASFATPVGYQTNTYVYGVGGYKFTDFARAGLPLNLLYFIASVALIPRLWPFTLE